jgi:peptidoglycan/LPS O-acetylase OafA/YrhL
VAFRPDVEGLRAVAVVLVVAFHAAVWPLGGGYLGVDVFFVISGFLITSLLVDEVRATGTIVLTDFYARRIRRLLPAAVLVLVATTLATAVLVPAVDRPQIAGDVRAAALLVANWHFAGGSTDYFAGSGDSPVLHYWSLSLEEQFYLVWPALLLVVAGRRRARRARTPAPRATDRRLWLLLAPVGLLSLGLSAATTASAGPWAYFGTHTRAWELAAGAAVALSRPQLHRLGERVAVFGGWMGLALVLGSAVVLGESTPVPGVALIAPVAGAAALVAAGARTQRGAATLLGRPRVAAIGRLSYSWYLWHWPCLVFARRIWSAPAVDDLPAPDAPWAIRLGAVALSLGLAALTYRFVEAPLRSARLLRPAGGRALPAGALLAAAAVIAPTVALATPPPPPVQAVAASPVTAPAPVPTPLAGRETGPSRSRGSSVPAAVPAHPAMTPAQARADEVGTRDCFAGFGPRSAPADCRFGDPGGDRVVVLVGDSHAAHWFPAFDAIARQRHWQLWFWAKSGCGYAQVREELAAYHREYTECTAWRSSVQARITALPEVDLVVVGRAISYLGQLLDASGAEVARDAARPVWAAGAAAALRDLGTGGRRVVLLRDVPRPGFDVPECLSSHANASSACTFPQAGHLHPDAALWTAEQPVTTAAEVGVVDLAPLICPADPCQTVSPGGAIIYRDDHHLTATFARSVSGAVATALAPYLPR